MPLLQSATIQDGGKAGGGSPDRFNTRFLSYDISDAAAPKLTAEYVVRLPRFKDAKGKQLVAAQSEIHALDGSSLPGNRARQWPWPEPQGCRPRSIAASISSTRLAATNIAGTDFDGTTPVAPEGKLDPSVTPAKYARFIDMNDNGQLESLRPAQRRAQRRQRAL